MSLADQSWMLNVLLVVSEERLNRRRLHSSVNFFASFCEKITLFSSTLCIHWPYTVCGLDWTRFVLFRCLIKLTSCSQTDFNWSKINVIQLLLLPSFATYCKYTSDFEVASQQNSFICFRPIAGRPAWHGSLQKRPLMGWTRANFPRRKLCPSIAYRKCT